MIRLKEMLAEKAGRGQKSVGLRDQIAAQCNGGPASKKLKTITLIRRMIRITMRLWLKSAIPKFIAPRRAGCGQPTSSWWRVSIPGGVPGGGGYPGVWASAPHDYIDPWDFTRDVSYIGLENP